LGFGEKGERVGKMERVEVGIRLKGIRVRLPENVSNDGHDGARTCIAESGGKPDLRFRKTLDKPFVQNRGES